MNFAFDIGRTVFVDAGAWVAYFNRRDRHHEAAVAIYAGLEQREVRLLTTDYVVDEAVTRLRYDANHPAAVQLLDLVRHRVEIKTVKFREIDAEAFYAAEKLFRNFNTARLSFTDCTSFVICKEERLTEVFGFDRHFEIIDLNLVQ